MCLVPDSDLFNAIKVGRASVVTDHIDQFDKRWNSNKSGEVIDADIIVAATGIEINALNDIDVSLDQIRELNLITNFHTKE